MPLCFSWLISVVFRLFFLYPILLLTERSFKLFALFIGGRLNKTPPNLTFRKKDKGGINFTSTVTNTHLDLETVKAICSEYRIHNADVSLRYDATADDLIDVIEGSRIYTPCIYVVNKIDQITLEELEILDKLPHYCPIRWIFTWYLAMFGSLDFPPTAKSLSLFFSFKFLTVLILSGISMDFWRRYGNTWIWLGYTQNRKGWTQITRILLLCHRRRKQWKTSATESTRIWWNNLNSECSYIDLQNICLLNFQSHN